ncbi:MAG: hypothetical protein FWF24_04805 [Alphaproteobacteria bacterium]|nr:hypothetical protein [Alphaproteobacteria bacterium]
MNLRSSTFFLVLLLALTGCARYVWVKPVGDASTFSADNLACKERSLAAAPPVYQTFVAARPYYYGPEIAHSQCARRGPRGYNCYTYTIGGPGPYMPPQTVDLNAAPRDDLYYACMTAAGWVLERLEE